MPNLPKITLNSAQTYIGSRNDKGQLCNIYTPLLNFVDAKTNILGDFTTELLNFDMEHPVDILIQDAYDGGVNLILNDNKNKPRLINSRFSVLDENTFKVTDHIGFKDSNVYDEATFNTETLLKQIPIKIPIVTYEGLKNEGGKLPVGCYTFYFKLADADGNETEVIAESGIVQCHIGDINTPKSIRMGMQDENSNKSIMFTLSNLDPGFSSVRVLYERRSSASDQIVASTYHKVMFDYSIDSSRTCFIEITGTELIVGISKEELYVDYADINAVKTLTIANNVLLFGNTKQTEHDWEELKRISWKIIPTYEQLPAGSVGSINTDYLDALTSGQDAIKDHGYCYYNTKNVYERVGYWPGEIYRFGIVYIFEDNSLSPVLDIQGIDFNLVKTPVQVLDPNESLFDKPSDYSKLFFIPEVETESLTADEWLYPCHLYDTESGYFNSQYRTNSRGVIRFPKDVQIYTTFDTVVPRPLYIKFDLSFIGYERAHIKDVVDFLSENTIDGDFPNWQDVLKKHNIKGFFFVRQKRVPMTVAQGVVIGLSDKDHGALPVLKSIDNKYIGQSFLGADRLLYSEGTTFKIPRNKTSDYTHQAMLVPDAELHLATFNLLFSSQEYCLEPVFNYTFNQKKDIYHYCSAITPSKNNVLHLVKMTNVTDSTKVTTNGIDYFSALAGSAEEAFKTEDLILSFNKTVPQDLTKSTSLVRGLWGSYVGLSNPNYNSNAEVQKEAPFKYGEVYNIKTKSCYGDENQSIDLIFKQSLNSLSPYFAISHRTEFKQSESCFRGDCFINMYTHRMNRNFIDPELPTNTKIVNPDCWALNYAVRCTALILTSAHSNLSKDNDGWYIGPKSASLRRKELRKLALIYFLTGNFIGGIIALNKLDKEESLSPDDLGLGDLYINPSKVVQADSTTYVSAVTGKLINVHKHNVYYKLKSVESNGNSGYIVTLEVDANTDQPIKFDDNDLNQIYPNGYANEVVQAFEMYVGPSKRTTSFGSNTDLSILTLKYDTNPTRKKVNPKELELNASGFNLKALFKSNDNWELHGVASINRADVNAVGLGQWITFPVMSSTNLQFRDLDFNQATEEAKFNKKRSFYPIQEFDLHNPLPDSVVINGAASCCLPGKIYQILPKTPFFKLEYFTRIYNSFRDTSNSITNLFRLILQNAYEDYTKIHGSITKLVSKGNLVYIIFAHGIGVLDLSAVQGKDAFSFLPPILILNPDIGSIWKDSIIDTSLGIFGVDSVAKKIWQIQGQNIIVISDMKVQKFLNDNLDLSEFIQKPYVGHINIKTHYNKYKDDVMFTYYNDVLWEVSKQYEDPIYSVDSEGFIVKETPEGLSERVIDNSGNLVKAIKKLLPYWDKDNEKWKSYSELIDLIDQSNCHKWQKGKTWSLCYNLRLGQFVTFYDWIPLESENIDNIYFSFDKDGIDYLMLNIYSPLEPQLYVGNTLITRNIGIPTNKHILDKAFTNITTSYHIKDSYGCEVSFDLDTTSKAFVCYLQNVKSSPITIDVLLDGTILNTDVILLPANSCRVLVIPREILDVSKYSSVKFASTDSYIISDPKLADVECVYPVDNGHYYILKSLENLKLELYDLRNSDNSLPLWKHGQAGVYDNQGEILPTNWYGKQREFNFEFVVNDSPNILKIFNNLKIISNKTEPNKFEYEIVGEGYDWWPYKPIVHWANTMVSKGEFLDLDAACIYILSNKVDIIRAAYPDFPKTILEYKAQLTSSPYLYKKLPYLKIELTDRQGRQDRSYYSDKYDFWKNERPLIDTIPRVYDFKFNTTETILTYDKQLNEYRIHDEQLGNNMYKYGRVRGNMLYLEDLWNIEIRPISFEWCRLSANNTLDKKKISESRHRDKYIKIKVRYSGKDLAVILQILTMYDLSLA